MERSETITINETAERLGISRALAYKAARNGEIPMIKVGKRFLVLRAGLDKMLSCPEPKPHKE